MRTLYKISLFLLALLFVMGAVGCAPKQAAGPVTIHILTMDQAGLKPAEIDQIARDFEAKNPDIKVNMEYLGSIMLFIAAVVVLTMIDNRPKTRKRRK